MAEEPVDELEIIREVMEDVQLSEFFPKIRDQFQASRLVHFDYVEVEDLEYIGLHKPAARRLLAAIKKKKSSLKSNRSLVAKLFPSVLGAKPQSLNSATSTTDQNIPIFTCLIAEKDLVLEKKLGDGSFGVVKAAKWTMPNNKTKQVAVKILKQDAIHVPGALGDFMKEVQAMHNLNHPNIISLYGIVLSNPLMMVTELAALGSLLDYLRKQDGKICIKIFKDYGLQIANGMKYLEQKDFVHRDLAARNVMMVSKYKLKIGDFGLMRMLPMEGNCYVMTEHTKVPFPWCAPESLKVKQFSHASDVWMYGVTLWEIFSFGEDPWVGLNGQQILKKIDQMNERLECPYAASASFYALMTNCWRKRPSDRPTFTQIYEFLEKLHINELRTTESFDESDRLKLACGDMVTVINGSPELYWWRGQNQRTLDIGEFPRSVTESLGTIGVEDISKPLPNSLLHTGHGGIDGHNWGNPTYIDPMILKSPMYPPDTLDNPPIHTKKYNSLRLRQKPANKFHYSKLKNEKWPEDVKVVHNDIQALADNVGDTLLIDLSEPDIVLRHRSYSASDLSIEPTEVTQRPNDQACNIPQSDTQSYQNSRGNEMTSYQNVPNMPLNNDTRSQTLRYPVRPAPPISQIKGLRKSLPATFSKYSQNNSQNYYNDNTEQCDIYADMHQYDMPPYESNLYQNTEESTTDEQIGRIWTQNVLKAHPNLSEPFNVNTDHSQNRTPSSHLYTNSASMSRPNYSQNTNYQASLLSEDIGLCSARTEPPRSPLQNSVKDISQSTPSLVPDPMEPIPQQLPKLDSAFIETLLKNLGKDQATANTFEGKDTNCLVPKGVPNYPQPKHVNNYFKDSLLSTSQPNLMASAVPSSKPPAFSDLDVISSSRSLGISPKIGLELNKFFKATAEVKPFNVQPPVSQNMNMMSTKQNTVQNSIDESLDLMKTDSRDDLMASQINYNKMVSEGSDIGGGGGSLVSRIAAVVPGTNWANAKQALHVASGDYVGAVQFLKVEKLYRLGLADKTDCEKILIENSWELERSASALVDKFV